MAENCKPSDGNFKNLLSPCPPSPLSEWETKYKNFFLKKNLFTFIEARDLTLLGHKKSCFPELIILFKEISQIAEVTTMAFCQIIIQKKFEICHCKTLKKKTQKRIKSELKKCYMKRSMLVFILKNSIILHIFFCM